MYDAELPLPLNAQEDADLYNYLVENLGITSAWLNGNDNNANGVWRDSYGNDITYFNWEQGQPNGETYLHYLPNTGGKWNDNIYTHDENIVCRKLPFGTLFSSHF